MDTSYLLQVLLDQGTLVSEEDGFRLSDGVRERIDARTTDFEAARTTELESVAAAVAPADTLVDEIVTLAESDPRSLAELAVLRDELTVSRPKRGCSCYPSSGCFGRYRSPRAASRTRSFPFRATTFPR